jgi:hypothetical protein
VLQHCGIQCVVHAWPSTTLQSLRLRLHGLWVREVPSWWRKGCSFVYQMTRTWAFNSPSMSISSWIRPNQSCKSRSCATFAIPGLIELSHVLRTVLRCGFACTVFGFRFLYSLIRCVALRCVAVLAGIPLALFTTPCTFKITTLAIERESLLAAIPLSNQTKRPKTKIPHVM